jgi:hypothetical protein
MRLSGALSNPQATSRLDAAARRHAEALARGQRSSPPRRATLRLPMGAIQGEVQAVLSHAMRPMRPAEIHEAVQRRVEQWISYDTVCM